MSRTSPLNWGLGTTAQECPASESSRMRHRDFRCPCGIASHPAVRRFDASLHGGQGVSPVAIRMIIAFALVAWLPVCTPAGEFKFKITHPEPEVDGRFGTSLATVGGNILIAAPASFEVGGSNGAVYLMDGQNGDLLQTFRSPSPNLGNFGRAVAAISDNDILIGGVEQNTAALGPPLGHFYHFDATTGALLDTFEPPVNEDTSYGQPITVAGGSILVGASQSSTAGPTFSGAAYLVDIETGEQLHRFRPPSPTTSGLFGDTIAMANDNVVVGSGGIDTDKAYVFSSSTGNLRYTIPSPDKGNDDLFGIRVAAEGNQILVSAALDDTAGPNSGAAYLFDANTGDLLQTFLNPTPEDNDFFGAALAIRGNQVLVAAHGDDSLRLDNGAVYLFDATSGDLVDTFLRPIAATIPERRFAGFGFGVGFLDNDHIFVADPFDDTGADRAGAVYVYETTGVKSLLGDCDGDNLLSSSDLHCISTTEARDSVLAALGTLPGDLDGDGEVAFADFLVLSANFGKELPSYVDGNINLQGGIAFEDFLLLANNFGEASRDVANAPDPTGGFAIWLGALSVTAWRRSNRR